MSTDYLPPIPAPEPPISDYAPPAIDRDLRNLDPMPTVEQQPAPTTQPSEEVPPRAI
ncbi:hypothetical protein GCM10009817_06580 [Terrabacter lapilli]|uniref:Uncharacterized protein n=1 Tax=Terrabacter lapilli TaxID=436231 RepID=A0ABN2RHM1_9MICO